MFGIGAVLIVSLFVLSLGLTGCGLFGQNDDTEPVDSVVEDLQKIVVLCNSPGGGLGPAMSSSLIDKINRAQTAYLSTQPCSAITIMNQYLEEVQPLRSSGGMVFEQLYQMGQTVISEIKLKYDCETPIPQ